MIEILKHDDLPRGFDPMGESLKDRKNAPYRAWLNEQYAIVLGASQRPENEIHIHQVYHDQVPVLRRSGGGGTVLLGPNGFCYGLRFIKNSEWTIQDYLSCGTGLLQELLHQEFGLETHQRGTADLCIDQQKILGCSLYMPRHYVLYLAAVLWGDESEKISQWLGHPSREPEYRSGRDHRDFVTNLRAHIPHIPSQEWFVNNLMSRALSKLTDYLDFEMCDSSLS